MHDAAFLFVARAVSTQRLDSRPLVAVELGACNVNGSVRALFHADTAWTGIDLRPGAGVDVVMAAEEYQPVRPVDVVVTTETLEHAPGWRDIIVNAAGILRAPGWLIVTAAGPGRTPHGCDGGSVGDEHYANIDPDALLDALNAAGFSASMVETNDVAGDVYGLGIMQGAQP